MVPLLLPRDDEDSYISIFAISLECCLITISNSFGKYLAFIVLPVWIFLLTSNDSKIWVAYIDDLFKTEGYYGVVDELNVDQDKIVHQVYSDQVLVFVLWMGIYFACASTILLIKHDPKSKIKGTYLNQLNLTIINVFTGLLDYITDLLLIFYWIYNKFYVFAMIELSFIIIGQIMSLLLIKDVPYHAGLPQKSQVVVQKSLLTRFTNIILSIAFCFGFGRIYHSLRKWNGNKYYEYEYKWCKLWEIMYESIASVVLSTYVTLMEITNNNSNTNISVSVVVSMIFSFISITNVIVSILNQDNASSSSKSDHINERMIANEIMTASGTASPRFQKPHVDSKDNADGTANEIEIIDINCKDNRQPIDLWVKDEQTCEISFFMEKVKPRKQSKSKKKSCPCESKWNQFLQFIFHFDVQIQNFIIWLFLTTDLFLKTLSILSIIIFVNYLFINNPNNNTINFNTNYMSKNEIENCVLSTVINVCFLMCLLLFEYQLYSFISKKSTGTYTGIKNDSELKYTILKYFMVGVFSNFFYFLSTVGLTYLKPLIDSKQFVNNQKFRCFISCFFVCLLLLFQILFDIWIFDWTFYLIFVGIMLSNVVCVLYLTRYVFVSA